MNYSALNYRAFLFFCVISPSLLLGGCGQTGPLYLPIPEDAQTEKKTPIEDNSAKLDTE